MKRLLALILLSTMPAAAADTAQKPKLVVTIVIDQFRNEYLNRFRSEFKGGLGRLLAQGAVFTNARYEHFPTVTAVGHSTILTGAFPSVSGIIGNEWYDRDTGKQVTSVLDESVRLLGAESAAGASPRRLLVSGLGDELKIATGGKSRVFGISLKDRAAILPASHSADAAFWVDGKSGRFVTSTYYLAALPEWVRQFNEDSADKYKGAEWLGHKPRTGQGAFTDLATSPFADELLESFAEKLIDVEHLGRGPETDLLSISFSANDYVGHQYGPDSAEVREMVVRMDMLLVKLFGCIESRVGMKNVLFVFTSDHGVAPTPEANAARKMPGGRIGGTAAREAAQNALAQKFGEGKWIVSPQESALYLNHELIREKGLDRKEVLDVARDAVAALPHVLRSFTWTELRTGSVLPDMVGRRLLNGFHARRAADIFIVFEPYWLTARSGTTHGSPFGYDNHVPVIFMGPGVQAGLYHASIAVNDIAPTLATMLEIEMPSGAAGRVLTEIMAKPGAVRSTPPTAPSRPRPRN